MLRCLQAGRSNSFSCWLSAAAAEPTSSSARLAASPWSVQRQPPAGTPTRRTSVAAVGSAGAGTETRAAAMTTQGGTAFLARTVPTELESSLEKGGKEYVNQVSLVFFDAPTRENISAHAHYQGSVGGNNSP